MRGSVKLLLVTLAVLFGKFLFWLFTEVDDMQRVNAIYGFFVLYGSFCFLEIIFRFIYNEYELAPYWLKYLNIITLIQFIIKQADEHI